MNLWPQHVRSRLTSYSSGRWIRTAGGEMNLWPQHVRSRLTLWYVVVLACLLAAYAGGASLFLFLSLREQVDRSLLEDLETVKGLLTNEPSGVVSLRAMHPEEDEAGLQRFVEVWAPSGMLLY